MFKSKIYYKFAQLWLLQIEATFITNWGSFGYYKLGQFLLQIGAASLLQIGARCYYKLGQLLQIGAKFITNWGSYYKLGQTLLQIGAAITNWGKLLQIRAQQHQIIDRYQYYRTFLKFWNV